MLTFKYQLNFLISVLLILFLFSSLSLVNAQSNVPEWFKCEPIANTPQNTSGITGGQWKPERVDQYTEDPNAYFPVLVVFVQFYNDPGNDWQNVWPINDHPIFIDKVIAYTKHNNSDWWNAYDENNYLFSDFWMEASRGHLHVTGQAVNVVLDNEYTYYQSYGEKGIEKINDDIYAYLLNHYSSSIDWTYYDKWTRNSAGDFTYTPDHYVDMIYKVFRTHVDGVGMPLGSASQLYDSYSQGVNYKINDNQQGNQIYINGRCEDGHASGVTMANGWPMNEYQIISLAVHEHGHFLWGFPHQRYGKMMGDNAENGLDNFLSPLESIQIGYMNSQIVNFSNSSYSIGDFTSRNDLLQGQVLEVPLSNMGLTRDFLLIANRQKISSYDRIMWGDTAKGDPFRKLING